MRRSQTLIVICALCIVVECGETVTTRIARTLPFDLYPTRWFNMFRSLWSGGRFWEWPRNSAGSVLSLFASTDTRRKMVIEFRPEDGRRAAEEYRRRYGYRGQWLIEWLGSGYFPDGVPYQQPLPASVLVPPPLPF